MKTAKEVLEFFNDFTFYDHYYIERVTQLNHVRNCANRVLSECDFIEEKKLWSVMC